MRQTIYNLIQKIQSADLDSLPERIAEVNKFMQEKQVTLSEAGNLNQAISRQFAKHRTQLANCKEVFIDCLSQQLALISSQNEITKTCISQHTSVNELTNA